MDVFSCDLPLTLLINVQTEWGILIKVKQRLKRKELTDFDSNPFFGHISRNNSERSYL